MAESKENYSCDFGSERVNTMVSMSPLSSALYSSLSYKMNAGKTSLAKMIVLFFLLGMITKETHLVPVQSLPFPT